jgi:hypothetical protein
MRRRTSDDAGPRPRGRATTGGPDAPGADATGTRTTDQLLRDALALRVLLDDLAPDDHALRSQLLLARDEVRHEAAGRWRRLGLRPITDDRPRD